MINNALTNLLDCNIKVGNKSVLCSGSLTYDAKNDLEFLGIEGLTLIIKFRSNNEKNYRCFQLLPKENNPKLGILTLYNYIPNAGIFQENIPITSKIHLAFAVFATPDKTALFNYTFFSEGK